MAAESMTDFDYDPIPLASPEVLASGVILDDALGFRDRLAKRRTVRDFSDEPIDSAVIEAWVLAAGHIAWQVCSGNSRQDRTGRVLQQIEEQSTDQRTQ